MKAPMRTGACSSSPVTSSVPTASGTNSVGLCSVVTEPARTATCRPGTFLGASASAYAATSATTGATGGPAPSTSAVHRSDQASLAPGPTPPSWPAWYSTRHPSDCRRAMVHSGRSNLPLRWSSVARAAASNWG
jgi:hypothetical protein